MDPGEFLRSTAVEDLFAARRDVRQHAQRTLIEVRCCCEPAKLLGYVRVSGFVRLEVGKPVVFLLKDPLERLELAYAEFGKHVEGEWMADGRAFKSNDTPIETLRRIVGWVDA